MKIVLITGMSGTGKTTIAKKLCENTKYNFVSSYTDRPMREKKEFGHDFIDSNMMDFILESCDIVAQTQIEEYRYCATVNQFDEDKINVYIVDSYGINGVIDTFPYADIMSILIRRNKIEADCVRLDRNVHVPVRDDVDFVVDNDGKLESAVNLINTLVNFDLFSKPSHKVEDIEDKLDYIDKQHRYLEEIKESLYTQLWYRDRPLYIDTCKHVEELINKDFDFPITITPDDSPAIYDGYLHFHIVGEYEYEDIMWADINRLVELLSYYAYTYAEEKGYSSLMYRLSVSEKYKGEDDYL